MHDNAAQKTVAFLLEQLADLNSDFWAAFSHPGWSKLHLQLALDTCLAMAVGVWWRVVFYLGKCPWRVWRAVDPAAPREARQRECTEIKQCCPACLDPNFTRPLLAQHSVDELAPESSDVRHQVVTAIRASRATNIMSELRFSRITMHMMSSKFVRAASASTMASKHMPAELAALHGRAVQAWEQEEGVPVGNFAEFTPKVAWRAWAAQVRVR